MKELLRAHPRLLGAGASSRSSTISTGSARARLGGAGGAGTSGGPAVVDGASPAQSTAEHFPPRSTTVTTPSRSGFSQHLVTHRFRSGGASWMRLARAVTIICTSSATWPP